MTARLTEPVTAADHLRGPREAPVTVVEYGDYQCPYCAAANPLLRRVLAERPGRVRLAYRHFPLPNLHPFAERAAQAAEAVAEADAERFWPAHDWLYAHQELIGPDLVPRLCAHLGTDAEAVQRAVDAGAHRERVSRDFASGVRSGVNGTPTLYLNGVRYDGSHDLADLLAAVDAVPVSA
ncbi:DsbA family protein [Rhizomonospora bruguierae]|uniref:DsbA family protein n=1 Tax=Rhizomonospora bruguierae TaxID=1581705 RepID=UPI001BCBFE66|nr:thioredoxin domain-containing protein [Micromonospora sp. NBRC 107566]